jgi:hypothetical protein
MRFMKHVTGVGLGTLQVFEDERKTRRLGGQPQAFWNHAWRDVHPANDFHLFMQPEAKSLSYVVGPGGEHHWGAPNYNPQTDGPPPMPFVTLYDPDVSRAVSDRGALPSTPGSLFRRAWLRLRNLAGRASIFVANPRH